MQALADSAGGDRLAVETVAGPDMALVDHWNGGTARHEIARGGRGGGGGVVGRIQPLQSPRNSTVQRIDAASGSSASTTA